MHTPISWHSLVVLHLHSKRLEYAQARCERSLSPHKSSQRRADIQYKRKTQHTRSELTANSGFGFLGIAFLHIWQRAQ